MPPDHLPQELGRDPRADPDQGLMERIWDPFGEAVELDLLPARLDHEKQQKNDGWMKTDIFWSEKGFWQQNLFKIVNNKN